MVNKILAAVRLRSPSERSYSPYSSLVVTLPIDEYDLFVEETSPHPGDSQDPTFTNRVKKIVLEELYGVRVVPGDVEELTISVRKD